MIAFRCIEADDAERLERFFYRLSPRTVYMRFFSPVHRPPKRMLRYLAEVDHRDREAIVAEVGAEIVGVARFDRLRDTDLAEVAVVVEDDYQGRGLGRELMRRLGEAALERGIRALTATMLGDNRRAIAMAKSVPGTTFEYDTDGIAAIIPLRSPPAMLAS